VISQAVFAPLAPNLALREVKFMKSILIYNLTSQ
jgi:hypothetical protein